MTLRMSARVAGLATAAAEVTAVATQAQNPASRVVCLMLIAFQAAGVVWATSRRSAATLRMVAPAALAGVTAAAAWTMVALAIPATTTGNTTALAAIAAAGLVAATSSGRRLTLALIASATCALLIFLTISWALPTAPSFVSHNHPPTYTDAIRMVDPIVEFAVFVLLGVALAVEVIRTRRTASWKAAPTPSDGPNERVIEISV